MAIWLLGRATLNAYFQRAGQSVKATTTTLTTILAMLCCFASAPALAQGIAEGGCKPAAERTQDLGCWIVAHQPVGEFDQSQVFWHLDTFPTRQAAEAAKSVRSTVVEALGKVWLLTIENADWRARGGERVSDIGPIPISPGMYSAQYMEAVFSPGMTSATHTHSGPEAWYTLAGEMCLETPGGKQVGRAGGPPVIVPAGPPMQLTATGTELRRALVLILHTSSKPSTSLAHDWTPKGLCKN